MIIFFLFENFFSGETEIAVTFVTAVTFVKSLNWVKSLRGNGPTDLKF